MPSKLVMRVRSPLPAPFLHRGARHRFMGDIINLRQARKAKARADKERLAQGNRAKFGRTKAERLTQSIEEERRKREIDGARRDDRKDDPD
ncbi:DUF4169 family protein [Sphingobium sp.]|uniref:DUF4169 family protein n=1 Tax=Sphingobium sp. TaxID=1912891 RepID=UPI0028BE3E64|nr:DUF4169 family protein [Sphingobium sp.]